VLNKLKNLFSGTSAEKSHQPALQTGNFSPTCQLYIVGDIHGCLTLLEGALERIDAHAATHEMADLKLVLLGDYVDRGPQSAQVLNRLYALQKDVPDKVVCLMGNHEKMMLDFIDDPAGRGLNWLEFGGADTLASYGIQVPSKKSDIEGLTQASIELEAAMPADLQDWLRALPLIFQSGNIACVHAAMDPDKPSGDQSSRVLLWGHRDFMTNGRNDDLWVVHGHTVVKSAYCQNSRIALDTGAYQSGQLSVAAVSTGQCTFL
jgi:serine/threonine protein phosphatase 1